jgi:hypothetical protein
MRSRSLWLEFQLTIRILWLASQLDAGKLHDEARLAQAADQTPSKCAVQSNVSVSHLILLS